MRNIYLIAFMIFIAILFSVCKKSTDPLIDGSIDTTSHKFVWDYDTFGISQSYLTGVSIISPDDIWAVGEINTEDTGIPDSNGVNIRPFNAVHWNGSEWELLRLKTARFDGPLGEDVINAVYAFSANDVWMFSKVGSYVHWNGSEWRTEFVWERKGGVNTIWGFSSNDLYFAGTNGSLTHYDGNSFTLLSSATTLDIGDIYGTIDPSTGHKEIIFIADASSPPPARDVFKVDDPHAVKINSDSLPGLISTLWFASNSVYYVGGDGLWTVERLGNVWTKVEGLLPYFKYDMIGLNENDVFIVGAFGFIAHYNGSTWYNYNENELPFINGLYAEVDVQDDLVITVGRSGLNAIILRGYRGQ